MLCFKNILPPRHSERIFVRHSERVNRERGREVEPAQGTKIERERGDLESLPEQRSREPEPAEEPVGPDQTLPSPTTGQGQALSDTQSEINPPPPKERTATSYINVSNTVVLFLCVFKELIKKKQTNKIKLFQLAHVFRSLQEVVNIYRGLQMVRKKARSLVI